MPRECVYELYVAVYQAVRQGIAAGDRDVVRRVAQLMAGRAGAASLAMTLGLIDARHGDAERPRDAFCLDVLCDRACPAWSGGRGPPR